MRAGLSRLQSSVPSLGHSDGHGHVREIDTRKGLAHRGKNGLLLCPQTEGASERGRFDSVRAGRGRVAYRDNDLKKIEERPHDGQPNRGSQVM